MDNRQARDLDNWITGHYGEDQFRDDCPDNPVNETTQEDETMTAISHVCQDCKPMHSGPAVWLCPKHAAAPQLLTALMAAEIHLEDIALGKATKCSDYDMAYIKAAIKAAGG